MKVFDGHCDTISRVYRRGIRLRKNDGHLDLERMASAGSWAQFFAIFASKKHADRPLWEIFLGEYEAFCREMEANADLVIHCRTGEEAERAWAQGKQAAFLSVEGSELLDCSLEKLEEAYKMGVRAVNLTWNYENAVSGTNVEGSEKGLTDHGRAFVRKMQELGMLVDVSHLSDPGFWDVIDLAEKPIFASHSNSRAVCPHTRNLTDEMFAALIKNGGVSGLNMCDEFVGEDPDVDTLIRHVEHWCSLGGEKNISLGGDWDGIRTAPMGISGIQDVNKLAEGLLRLNYSESVVNGILSENLMRVVKQVCTM